MPPTPDPSAVGIRRWGLWEVLRSGGWSLGMRLASVERRLLRALVLSTLLLAGPGRRWPPATQEASPLHQALKPRRPRLGPPIPKTVTRAVLWFVSRSAGGIF